jgi:hypothetical protein
MIADFETRIGMELYTENQYEAILKYDDLNLNCLLWYVTDAGKTYYSN